MVTVASLKDLGYKVDLSKAEAYTLPNRLRMAESGTALLRPLAAAGK